MMKSGLVLGIDIGGTKLSAGLVSRSGLAGEVRSAATHAQEGPDRVMEQIRDLIGQLAGGPGSRVEIDGIGVGAPGPIDIRSGIVKTMPNLPEWEGYRLKKILENRTGRPVRLINDADAAALSEYYFGRARERKTFATLTLGTGIGSSIMLNGRLWHGASGVSPELAHIPISGSGPKCGCGGRGHLESFLSSHHMIERVRRAVALGEPTSIDMLWLVSEDGGMREIIEAARRRDRVAVREMQRYGKYLGRGLAVLTNLLNLPLVILAGGISNAWDLIETSARRELKRHVFLALADRLTIVVSAFRENAGVLGAGTLFFPETDRIVDWNDA